MKKTPEKTIEKAALKLRERLGFQQVNAPAMDAMLAAAEDQLEEFGVKTELRSKMNGDEAWFNSTTKTMTIAESVLHEIGMGKTRARFTAAHELGHYALEHRGNPRRNPDKGSTYYTPEEHRMEWEANVFASYLLVPTHLAKDATSPQDIEGKFQVGSATAEIAFERIQKALRLKTGSTRRPPQSVIDFLEESRRRGYEVKSRIDFDDE